MRFRLPLLCVCTAVVLMTCASARSSLAAGCVDWPRVMAEAELARLPNGVTAVVQPFTDYTKRDGDDWMALGLRDFVADLMRSSDKLRVLAGQTATYGLKSGAADFIVSGIFQHNDDNMRVFIRLADGKSGQLIAQQEAAFPYPENEGFFAQIANISKKIMETMKANPDSGRIDSVAGATSSTRAYEQFSRGRQLMETYRLDKANQSEEFFTAAKRIDYKSPLGYDGIVGLYTFRALNKKQAGESSGTDYQKAQEEYVHMVQLTKPGSPVFGYIPKKPGKKDLGQLKLNNRFLAGQTAFNEGMIAAEAGNNSSAAEALSRAVALVPEDAVAWSKLSNIESKLGEQQKAQEAWQKALSINSCIK